MEGQTKLHKRDHHSTNIPDNVTTQRSKKRRIRTPVIIKLVLAVIFVSIWWLILNIYVMNNSSLQSSAKENAVDPRHLEEDDDVVGAVDEIIKEVMDSQGEQGGDQGGLELDQQQMDGAVAAAAAVEDDGEEEEDWEEYDDDGPVVPFRGATLYQMALQNGDGQNVVNPEERQENMGNGLDQQQQVIQDQNMNQIVLDNPQGQLPQNGQLGGNEGEMQLENKIADVNGQIKAENAQLDGNNFDPNQGINEIVDNHKGHDDDNDDGPIQQDVNDNIRNQIVNNKDRDVDINQQMADNVAQANIPQIGNQFDGQINQANVINDRNDKNADVVMVNDNNVLDERIAQAVVENFGDEEFNPDQKVGDKIVAARNDEQKQERKVIEQKGQGEHERVDQDDSVAHANRNVFGDRQQDSQNIRLMPAQADDVQDGGAVQEDSLDSDDDGDMAHALERIVQDDKLSDQDDRLDDVQNDHLVQVQEVQGKVQKVDRGQDENLAQVQERMVQDDRLDNIKNMRQDMRQDDRINNGIQQNDLDENKQQRIMVDENEGEQQAVFLNQEQMREVEKREIRRHEVLEKFKSFLDEKEKEVDQEEQAEGNVQHERNRPAIEKIRDMDERTLPYDLNAPGEGGKGLKELPWEHDAIQREWPKAEFNLYFSDKISLERSLPEARREKCLHKTYLYSLLPKTSIIICFTEEAWSPLLRTLHSIINRSPPELVEDIILVDDFSQADHLKKPLEDYISQFPQVKIVRLPYRHGLIRARLAGVEAARGPVITFLDSHIEVHVGWLEPLLDRIREDRTNVVAPVIDAIDAHTLAYGVASDSLRGGFSWVSLQFRWKNAPDDVMNARKDETDGVPSPTMAGGLFSIDKQYFIELGTYDPGLEIWGAENIELSLKIWMCGGRLEILPCSRVGHIFRARQPYKFPSGNNIGTFIRNTLRIVNVWLDDYKDVFYAVNPTLVDVDYGDITERLRFRQQLQCKNFDWFVKNVYRDLTIPPTDWVAIGALVNLKSRWCLDKNGDKPSLAVFPCHGQGSNQAFRLTSNGILAVAEICVLGGAPRTGPLVEGSCKSTRVIRWQHTKGGFLKNKETGLCLGVAAERKMAMMPCFQAGPHLQWTFDKYRES